MTFSSIFISFSACVNGLIGGFRSFIGVDGAHLKWQYGNNQLFPIAWAIVSCEDQELRSF